MFSSVSFYSNNVAGQKWQCRPVRPLICTVFIYKFLYRSLDGGFQSCGSGMFIPAPGSRVKKITDLHKIILVFQPKKLFQKSRKYDPGCSSRIPDLDFLPIPDP
jgi:hypothetical protein